MKRAISNLNENFQRNKWIYILTTLFLCIGFVLGVYTVFYMGQGIKSDLSKYLQSFIEELENQQINYAALVVDSIKNNALIFLFLFAVGLLSLGGPIILITLLIKGYALGFTFALMANILGGKGIGISIIALIPQNLLFIPCLIIFASITLQVSISKLKSKFGENFDLKQNIKASFNLLLLISIVLLMGVVVEAFVTPTILRYIILKV
jgi:stage II sporulation protein M